MKKMFVILLAVVSSTSLFGGWIINQSYTAFWDSDLNATTLVLYMLDKEDVVCEEPIQKRPSFFQTEDGGYDKHQYYQSHYDRGHLASHRSFACSKEKLKHTYNMVNVIPMHPYVNRYVWYRYEKLERSLAELYQHIFVVNKIFYEDNTTVHGMRIPTSFRKCIVYDNQEVCTRVSNRDKEEVVNERSSRHEATQNF